MSAHLGGMANSWRGGPALKYKKKKSKNHGSFSVVTAVLSVHLVQSDCFLLFVCTC